MRYKGEQKMEQKYKNVYGGRAKNFYMQYITNSLKILPPGSSAAPGFQSGGGRDF